MPTYWTDAPTPTFNMTLGPDDDDDSSAATVAELRAALERIYAEPEDALQVQAWARAALDR